MHWLLLIAAIINLESGGRLQARGLHGELGPMQIKPSVVADVNRIYGTHYTLNDRANLERSKEMFRLYVDYYCTAERLHHQPTDADAARLWKEGPTNMGNARAREYARRILSGIRIEQAGQPVRFTLN